MSMPAFTSDLHRRITLATDLQSIVDVGLNELHSDHFAHNYGVPREVASHLIEKEKHHRGIA